jgi:hypothetical protein
VTSGFVRGHRAQFAAAGAAALAVAAVAAVTLVRRGSGRSIAPPAATSSAQHIDYTLKSSLLALVRSADLICACTVISAAPSYTATPRIDGTGIGPASQGIAVRDFAVRVDRVLRSNAPPGSTITVTQAAGSAAADNDDPPLVAGAHYVLFLRRAANGKYGLVSGPQGLLLVDAQNRLQPALNDDPVMGLLRNRKLDQLVELLRGAIATPSP